MSENNEMTPELMVKSFEAKIAEKTKGLATTEIVDGLKSEFEAMKNEIAEKNDNSEMQTKFVELESAIAGLKENAKNAPVAKKSLLDLVTEKGESIKNMIRSKSGIVELALKAIQTPADITLGSDYAQFLEGTVEKPVRATRIIDLFRRTSVSTEYVKYREEDVVTRDAKVVVACATSTHNTKKTWITRTVQIAKIRDFVDVCIDMMDDYSFVESEINS